MERIGFYESQSSDFFFFAFSFSDIEEEGFNSVALYTYSNGVECLDVSANWLQIFFLGFCLHLYNNNNIINYNLFIKEYLDFVLEKHFLKKKIITLK